MKKIILLSGIIFYCFGIFGQSKDTIYVQGDTVILKKDTAVRNKLLTVDLKSYIGKTVGDLLKNETIRLYKSYWWSTEPPLKLYALNLTYARGLDVTIVVYPLKYQPRYSETNKFSFELYKKETITNIKLDRSFFENNVVKKYSQ
jgi:hypothetical protein